jgi:hypothetical protein
LWAAWGAFGDGGTQSRSNLPAKDCRTPDPCAKLSCGEFHFDSWPSTRFGIVPGASD